MKIRRKQNLHYVSLRESDYYHLWKDSTLTTQLAGSIKTSVAGWSSSAKTWWTRRVQDLCSLCRRVTGSRPLRRLRSRLGIWGEILATNLLVARIRVRLLWASAERFDSSSASLLTRLRFKLDSILTASLRRLGLLQAAAVMLQLVSEVVLQVRERTFFLSTIPSRTERMLKARTTGIVLGIGILVLLIHVLLRVVEYLLFSLVGMTMI